MEYPQYIPPPQSWRGVHLRSLSDHQPDIPHVQSSYQKPTLEMESSITADHVNEVYRRFKPTCWDHGCNGRQFSTFSNLLRHVREKENQPEPPSSQRRTHALEEFQMQSLPLEQKNKTRDIIPLWDQDNVAAREHSPYSSPPSTNPLAAYEEDYQRGRSLRRRDSK
jgi:hypothetical protein